MDNPKPKPQQPAAGPSSGKPAKDPNGYRPVEYKMRLFVAGDETNSRQAKRNIDEICSQYLAGNFELVVIDVFEDFAIALQENILVTPALLLDKPKKVKIFGNLQDRAKVVFALGLP